MFICWTTLFAIAIILSTAKYCIGTAILHFIITDQTQSVGGCSISVSTLCLSIYRWMVIVIITWMTGCIPSPGHDRMGQRTVFHPFIFISGVLGSIQKSNQGRMCSLLLIKMITVQFCEGGNKAEKTRNMCPSCCWSNTQEALRKRSSNSRKESVIIHQQQWTDDFYPSGSCCNHLLSFPCHF